MTSLPERAARRCHAVVNPFHSTLYFSPDLGREFARAGLDDACAAYFAARAAPLGRAGAGTVTAAFYNFRHDLVARHIPRAWDSVSPEDALDARLRAADSLLRRLLGEEVLASKELAEAAELALRAAEACARPARPLYAANADLPVPEAPHLAYWHAATLLREYRGDGHLAALLRAGLDPLEALASHTASGRGMSPKWVLASRGWSQEEWEAAKERLRGRGLLDDGGELTASGTELRTALEDETDRLDRAPYEHLGAAGVARLTELGGALAGVAQEAGAFPADLIGKR
ncbi:SCO6745 family protein [Streptomyces scopuliridis]|uniref:SCO6745 family protein n=1 Tax=Streptomyces scopuliridis TaxID=452529 RepID=UPI0035D6CA63